MERAYFSAVPARRGRLLALCSNGWMSLSLRPELLLPRVMNVM